MRETYMTIEPHVKAITTDSRMAETTPMARDVLMNSPSEVMSIEGSFEIL